MRMKARVQHGSVRVLLCLSLLGLAHAPEAVAADAVAGAFLGPKKTVFVDVVGAAEVIAGGTTNEGLNAMLVAELMRDGRFVVVERVALGDIQLEQQLAKAGATTVETGAASGQMLGASAVVRATVTKFEAAAGGNALQVGGLPLGRLMSGMIGMSGQQALVEFNIRVIDTSTGQIVASSSASGTANSSSVNLSASHNNSGANVGANSFNATPLGTAAEVAIKVAVKQIVLGMERVRWSAHVVEFDEGKVYISAGAAHNLKAGDTLQVYRKGKILTDPATGVVLDTLMTRIATIELGSVSEKIAVGSLVSGNAPARGDVIKVE